MLHRALAAQVAPLGVLMVGLRLRHRRFYRGRQDFWGYMVVGIVGHQAEEALVAILRDTSQG